MHAAMFTTGFVDNALSNTDPSVNAPLFQVFSGLTDMVWWEAAVSVSEHDAFCINSCAQTTLWLKKRANFGGL